MNKWMQKIVFPAAIIGTSLTMIIVQFQVAVSLSPTEVSQIAKAVAVRIAGQGNGSGVIIARQGNTYAVLTNWHVVEQPESYRIRTVDSRSHSVTSKRELKGAD